MTERIETTRCHDCDLCGKEIECYFVNRHRLMVNDTEKDMCDDCLKLCSKRYKEEKDEY